MKLSDFPTPLRQVDLRRKLGFQGTISSRQPKIVHLCQNIATGGGRYSIRYHKTGLIQLQTQIICVAVYMKRVKNIYNILISSVSGMLSALNLLEVLL